MKRNFAHLNCKGRRLGTTGLGVTALIAAVEGKLPLLAAFCNRELHGFGNGTKAVNKFDQAGIGSDFKNKVVEAVGQGVSCSCHGVVV